MWQRSTARRVDAQPDQDVAAERLDQRHAFAAAAPDGRAIDRPAVRPASARSGQALLDLARCGSRRGHSRRPPVSTGTSNSARRRADSQSRRASKSRPEARPTKPPAPNRCARSGCRMPVATVRSCSEASSSYSRISAASGCAHLVDQRRGCARHRRPSGRLRRRRARCGPSSADGRSTGGRAQHVFAQHRAMRQHDAERGIVADRAEVAEVVGQPFQFRHHAAQPHGARRRFDPSAASTARAKASA